MSARFNLALALLLCAGRAVCLGTGGNTAHVHDSAGHGGSTLRPAILSMTASSLATFGPTVFTSSVTVGALIYITTPTTSTSTVYGRSVNQWMIVASTNPSEATSVSFTGLRPDARYRMTVRLIQNTSDSQHIIRFNNDSAANYGYSLHRTDTSGNTNLDVANQGGATGIAHGVVHVIIATGKAHMVFEFETEQGDSTRVIVSPMLASYNTALAIRLQSVTGLGIYDGASALSSIQYIASAGTMTGYIILEQMIYPLK